MPATSALICVHLRLISFFAFTSSLRENCWMTIFINGEARALDGVSTLAALLDALELPKQRVAIELNKRVIRKQDWDETSVNDQDKVEVVHFVGGG